MISGSGKLNEAIVAVEALAGRREVGTSIRSELLELVHLMGGQAGRLAEIENLYALDFGDDIDPRISEAARLWEATPTGWVRDPELAAIRAASPLLGTLYRKGIDFTQAYRFSDIEIALSREIGNSYSELSPQLAAFRRSSRPIEDEKGMKALLPLRRSLDRLLRLFEGRGVLRVKRMMIKGKEGRWTPFKREWMRDSESESVLLIYEKMDIGLARLVEGEWLNCYIYHIIRDQLSRHELPFELYTNLSYRAPADLIRAAGEFDVVGRMRDAVVCVECKSGRLDGRRGDFAEIVRKTDSLKTVLAAQSTGELGFHFFLVYDPDQNDPQAVTDVLAEDNVIAIRPSEVRSVMARALSV
jgi:hypothetical protein